MERRTIGGFIAALRKANGMTQKALAEQLNVSDKTVSRWERDEGAPDLSLIPVLAEIFDVTCDELLRGERSSAQEDHQANLTPKGEKGRQRLLAVSLSRYKNRSFIAAGFSVAGLIAAMIGNLGFLRAYIGFFAGLAFYLVSVIAQMVFVNNAFLAVSDESLAGEEVEAYKWSVIRLAEWSTGLSVVLFGASLPLVIFPGGPYVGVTGESWLVSGVCYGIIAFLVFAAACSGLNARLLKKGLYHLTPQQEQARNQNQRLKRRCAGGLALVLIVTFAAHMLTTEVWGPRSLAKGVQFNDYDSFIAYMEQDIPYTGSTIGREPPSTAVHSADVHYYDEQGNEISQEQAIRRTLEDANGRVVCTYLDRNELVSHIRYTVQEDTVLPITVFTREEMQRVWSVVAVLERVFVAAYAVEVLAASMFYLKKRNKG